MAIARLLLGAAGPAALPGLLLVVALGAAGGGANAALVALVHRAVSGEAAVDGHTALLFAALAAARLLTNFGAGRVLIHNAESAMRVLRQRIVRASLDMDLQQLQRTGEARILTVLEHDVTATASLLQILPSLVINGAMTVGSLGYLMYLSPPLVIALLAAGLVGGLLSELQRRGAQALYEQGRDRYDALFAVFRSAILGVKELKQHAPRRQAFLRDALDRTARQQQVLQERSQRRFLAMNATHGAVHLLLIGAVLFWLGPDADPKLVSGYVLTSLFVMGPSSVLVRGIGVLSAAEVGLRRMQALGVTMDAAPEPAQASPREAPSFREVTLEGVSFEYDGPVDAAGDAGQGGFHLGPIDLSLRPGQLTVITGDNGSGKSTLVRVIAGLHAPDSGTLRWDAAPVSEDRREAYRQLLSVVHFDFHVFDALYGLKTDAGAEQLRALGIGDAVQVRDGALHHGPLSSGQQRRLALATALLEARPILLLDEIGADQDPQFRAYLYGTLLPELRARGRCIVLVTHDGRAFPEADQQLRLQSGRIVAHGPALAPPPPRTE